MQHVTASIEFELADHRALSQIALDSASFVLKDCDRCSCPVVVVDFFRWLADAMLRPPNSVGRIGVHDVAGGQPIEQHPDRGQVLLDGVFGMGAAELLDVGGYVHGRHPRKIFQTSLRAPGGEGLDGLEVGPSSMDIAGVDGEELPEATAALGGWPGTELGAGH